MLVPVENLESLVEKLTKLAKKAAKLACGPISWTIGERTIAPVTVYGTGSRQSTVRMPCVEVAVTGSAPSLNGWAFVASIEHLSTGNVIRAVPGTDVAVPESYRSAKAFCSHCGKVRSRTETYLVSKDGQVKQVGKSCLKDHTGHKSPEAVLAYARLLFEASDEVYGSLRVADVQDINLYLARVCASVRLVGFHKAGDKHATCHAAWSYAGDESLQDKVTEADVAEATAALAWIAGQTATSDYINNLKVLCSEGCVTHRNKGMVASLIATYQRAIGEVAERAAKATSAHIGAVGGKVTVTATLTKRFGFMTEYGYSESVIFHTTDGNVVIWKTSAACDLDTGSTYELTGTVKAHGEYKGTLQTVLTRCKAKPVAVAA